MSNVKCKIFDVKCKISNVKRQIWYVKYLMSNVKYFMSNVKYQMTNVKLLYNDRSVLIRLAHRLYTDVQIFFNFFNFFFFGGGYWWAHSSSWLVLISNTPWSVYLMWGGGAVRSDILRISLTRASGDCNIYNLKSRRPSGARLLGSGPLGLLDNFGRSGRVTHATVQSLDSAFREIQKIQSPSESEVLIATFCCWWEGMVLEICNHSKVGWKWKYRVVFLTGSP